MIHPGRPCGSVSFAFVTEYRSTASNASAIGETTQSVLDPVRPGIESEKESRAEQCAQRPDDTSETVVQWRLDLDERADGHIDETCQTPEYGTKSGARGCSCHEVATLSYTASASGAVKQCHCEDRPYGARQRFAMCRVARRRDFLALTQATVPEEPGVAGL